MKDLIIKALNEVFESVTKSTPKVKTNEEFFDADECSITDLQQIIKNNNLPQDICLELWHPENDNGNWCYDGDGYPIDALGFVKRSKSPTTDKEQLKYKTTEMRTKAWSTIKYSLLNSGYDFSNYKYYARLLSSVPMPYNSAKKIILYEVRVDNLPDLSSYKCKSFFKNSAGKLVPEVIGYAYKPITELSIWLFPNYKKIIDKIKL